MFLPWKPLDSSVKTLQDVLTAADLDWQVQVRELSAVTSTGQHLPLHSHYATVRVNSDGEEVAAIGVVQSHYKVLQHTELFKAAEPYVLEGFGTWESAYHTPDMVDVGVIVRMSSDIDLGDGEGAAMYLQFLTRHNNTKAGQVLLTPVKLDCTNQMGRALSSAAGSWRICHVGNVESNIKNMRASIDKIMQYESSMKQVCDTMRQLKMSLPQMEQTLIQAIPHAPRLRQHIIETVQTSANVQKYNMSGWRLFNATTEWLSHGRTYASSTHKLRSLQQGGSASVISEVSAAILNHV
jgi:hypothetical protein